jgi:hypothetical protein
MDCIMPAVIRESQVSSLAPKEKLNTLVISETEYQNRYKILQQTVADTPDQQTLDLYLRERPSENALFRDLMARQLISYAREDQTQGLKVMLSLLSSRAGALVLTGRVTPFHLLDIPARTQVLNAMAFHVLPPVRLIFKTFTALAKSMFFKASPIWPAVSGFPRVPDEWSPGPSHPYKFLQFSQSTEPAVLEYDVVIVGSGVGAGVTAKNLSEAGFKVLVVDKAYYYPPEQLPMTEAEGQVHLFEAGGVDVSDDSSLNIISGSNFGGGGSINWSASLQPQGFVRREWAQDRGLTQFEGPEFQESLDRVCQRMGVHTENIRHNHGNAKLLEGARRMGYTAKAVPQNTDNQEHYCGHCAVGCGSAVKQGPNVCWLPDAACAGADFIEGLLVEKVMFKNKGGKKVAVGIKGLWTGRNAQGSVDGPLADRPQRQILVKAKKVVMSAGTLWSPVILKNSGLTVS